MFFSLIFSFPYGLQGKYQDDQMTRILTIALLENLPDIDGDPCRARYMAKTLKLFGRISATSAGTSQFWHCYALLLMANGDQDSIRIATFLAKSHRQYMMGAENWLAEPGKIVRLLGHCCMMADDYLKCALIDSANRVNVLNSYRLSLASILVQANKARVDLDGKLDGEQMDQVVERIGQTQAKLTRIIEVMEGGE